MASTTTPSSFTSSVFMTHISTATAILSIDGINFLIDPAFDSAGSEYPIGKVKLVRFDGPALQLHDLPPIDAILLSHEDHPDNLDPSGRTLLNGRRVLTTQAGAKNLAPRPGVQGLAPWETVELLAAGKTFRITATPCDHLPGGECIGFVVHTDSFGVDANGRPNVIYVSGDTVYMESVAQRLRAEYNVVLAVLNLGAAMVSLPTGPTMITMDGKQAVQLTREIEADVMIPLHYESWGHFAQGKDGIQEVFNGPDAKELKSSVAWLEPGVCTRVV
ncbi:hypothetical protein Poli38472_010718 [Pythium oligandrum]|uniref:Metallo-beta-lactamase domain-containing protein n=1 Tax=Pythium oligandrum TaxID=41045 RepID=A0A8K1CF44_PYTOL|nr:hypothetical protein Poli38472_010718 [Pythium oligandrum]|eukprot:TMW61655.1 hypothetical protein Poli38472_010718 [Pythium oligandrum]